MTVVAIVPALVMVVGLLLWCLPVPPKVSEAGKWMFVCGLLVTLCVMAKHVVKL